MKTQDKLQIIIYANIDDKEITDIKKYLFNKTLYYNKSKHKEFYKQCINSNIKITKQDEMIIYDLKEIKSFIFPDNLDESEKQISLIKIQKIIIIINYYVK